MTDKHKMTILNVDDDDVGRYATSRTLRRAGFEVIEAANGAEALQLVKERPDLVILDVNLPDIHGFEVCRRIRADPATSLIPVLHLSAIHLDDQSRVEGLESGADGYLTRPMEPSVLIAYVKAVLRIRQVEAEAVAAGQQWQTTFDAISDSVSLLDMEGKVLRCNEAMSKLLGKPFSEIIGRPCWELVHGASEPIEGCPIVRLLETRRRETLVLPVGEQWFNVAVDPLLDEAGNLIGGIHIMSDITERKRVEEALRESKQLLERTFASLHDAVFIIDGDTTEIMDCNSAASEIFGYSREEMLGRTTAFLHVDQATLEEFRQRLYPAVEEKGFLFLPEFRMKRRGGTVFPTEHSVMPLQDEGGKRIGWVSVVRDITKRKRAEEALAQERNLLRALMDNVPDYIYFKDRESRFIRTTKAHAKTFGLSDPAEAIGKTDFDFFSDEHAHQAYEDEQEIIRTGQPLLNMEERETWPDRPDTWVLTSKMPLRDEEGKIVGTFGISKDITDRKRAEEALRESEQRFRMVLESSMDNLYRRNLETDTYDYMSPAVERISGYSVEELLSMPLDSVVSMIHPDDIDRVKRVMGESMTSDRATYLLEYRFRHKDGQYRWLSDLFTVVRDAQGHPLYFVGNVRDITERKRAEEELHRRAKELAALQATVLDITAPHDLPTLLQTIVERAALLLNALGGGLYLCDPDRREVRCVVSYNTPHDYTGTVLKYGEGAAGTVAQTRQPLIIDDYRVWNRRAAVYEEEQPFTAVLSAPMIWQGQVTGVIHVLHDVESRRFTEADLELLTLFANHAAIAVENARLYEEARQEITERKQRERELEAIAAMSAALRTATTRTEMLPVILDQLLDLLKVEGAALGIRDPTIDETVIELGRGVWADWTDIRLPPSEGISGHVISTGQFYLNNDVQNDPQMTHLHLLGDLRAVACVPLIAQERIIGVLWMGRKTDITEEEARLLTAIADMFANAIQRATLHEQTEKRAQHLAALHSVDMAVSSTLDLTKVLDIILEELERVIPYHDAGIFLFSDGTAKLTAGRGFPDLERVLQVSFPVQEDALTREVLREKRPLVLADAQADDRFLLARGGTVYVRSWIGAPLIAKGKAIGLLTVDHREPGAYDEESAEMVQAFANQAAIAIENAQLYEETQRELAERKRAEEKLRRSYVELRRALEGTVNVLTSAIEIRDPYTAGHQRRVTNLACAIATEMGLSEEQIEGLRMAGLIHDVGKINVPADILSKPGRLSDLEYGLIKAHPQVGYDILKGVDFPWPVAEMVLQHHERMDGSGYPQGLSGEEIMLEARVLAVADVVAAMASHRPYRPALGIEKALEEISMNRGVLYEPEVVDVCLRLFIEKRFTFE